MKLQTLQFGEIEFEQDKIIEFKDGILGFEQYKKYILLAEEEGVFYWLTSIDEPEIVFPLFPIDVLEEEYPKDEGFRPFAIVKLDKNPAEITANLRAPVYIDTENQIGKQIVIDEEKYPVDYQLFVENPTE
jgi:flagellar assembly factor FliW